MEPQMKNKKIEYQIAGAVEFISEYEAMSGIICERCGKPASIRSIRGWLCTLCDEHFKQFQKEVAEGI